MTPKTKIIGVVGLTLLIVLVGSLLFFRANNDSHMSITPGTMQAMMGTKNADTLPVKTAQAAQPLQPTIKDGVKEFSLTAEPVRWEYAKGKTILAWAYNGQVPGPEIRVTEGDKVRIMFTNKLPKDTTVHWHGLNVPNNMDGVPGVTQRAIKPGDSFTYEFTATPAGTHFYHPHGSGHGDEAQQLDMGLSSAFIVEQKEQAKPDRDYTLVLDEWQRGSDGSNAALSDHMEGMNMAMNFNLFTINGKAYPDTKALNVKQGERVRVRLINAGSSAAHPMHLHGQQFKIVATDGSPVPEAAQLTKNTITVNPGETYDIEFTADNPGVWAFHCHELHHAGSGMVTTIQYEGVQAPVSEPTPTTDTNSNDDMHGMHNMEGM